ncbi:MAG: hypothetical protein KGH58_03135 [Candidatus Micrarchaeota archaeon]|nr:hypothetical protein [Candidatus Micrarchaeota archaeon]
MALAILVIGVFIFFGASALFYSVLLIGIVFGFVNGWLISRHERMRGKAPPSPARYTRIPERKRPRGRKSRRK